MNTDNLVEFTKYRGVFEDFIIHNKTLISQIISKFGSKESGRENISRFYKVMLSVMLSGIEQSMITDYIIQKDNHFSFLQPAEQAESIVYSQNFSADTKSAVIIRENLGKTPRCGICRGLMVPRSITVDHIVDKRSGGIGSISNAQLAHPFCNSTAKDRLVHA